MSSPLKEGRLPGDDMVVKVKIKVRRVAGVVCPAGGGWVGGGTAPRHGPFSRGEGVKQDG